VNIPAELKPEAEELLLGNILPFWDKYMPDDKYGGFHGRIDGHNNIVPGAQKGGILNARILWTYSAVYNWLGGSPRLKMAIQAVEYILEHFFDFEYGGTWWSLDANGEPHDKKKQIYSQAYFIYALCEYYRATGDRISLEKAIGLYQLIEEHGYDRVNEGYFEAFDNEWKILDDQRLSDKDMNERKSMNTHLHVLEAYSNLYPVWPDESLRSRIAELLKIFTEWITDSVTGHLNLFFDERWKVKSDIISYGHDIEASWLLCEAVNALDDSKMYDSVRPVILKLANAALEGLQNDGSLVYEKNLTADSTDMDRHWWVQAEAVIGLINAWQLTGENRYLEMAYRCFNYIKDKLVDRDKGEWYWSIRADGTINREGDKAGFWKCPYHNGRMCLEIMKRL
jgi:mannobiose 2-epimerase